MFNLIQVLVLIFAVFALSRVILRMKSGNLSVREFIFWSLLWLLAILFFVFPDWTTSIALFFGIERGINLIVSVSIILLFYLIFRIYIKIESVEQEISEVVRQIAIEKKKKK
ncbi:MAG: DUF2304 family protein [Nanoarchaeota archaeon]